GDEAFAGGAARGGGQGRERVDRVLPRPAEQAGVEVRRRTTNVDLHAGQAARGNAQRRLVRGPLPAVAADDEVAGEAVLVGGDELRKLRTADLLLAFQEELQVQRHPAVRLHHRLAAPHPRAALA